MVDTFLWKLQKVQPVLGQDYWMKLMQWRLNLFNISSYSTILIDLKQLFFKEIEINIRKLWHANCQRLQQSDWLSFFPAFLLKQKAFSFTIMKIIAFLLKLYAYKWRGGGNTWPEMLQ